MSSYSLINSEFLSLFFMFKSSDLIDKDAWKNNGTGQLSISCSKRVSKGTKKKKKTIVA